MDEQRPTILDYIYILLKWKYFIILFTVTATVITAGITLILPKWYKASTAILIPQEELPTSLTSLYTKIPAGLKKSFFSANEQSLRYLAILKSVSADKYIAQKYNLQKLYKIKNLDETIKELQSHKKIDFTDEGAIVVNVEDRSPVQASEMANDYMHFLDSLNIKLQTDEARFYREFLGNRLSENICSLQAAEDSLKEFQERNKVISLPEQLESQIKAYSELNATLLNKQVLLEMGLKTLAPDHPQITELQTEIQSIKKQLTQFEKEPGFIQTRNDTLKFLVPFAETPRIGTEYVRLKRGVEVQNTLFALLTEQYEQAKMQEAKDTPTLQVLDKATPQFKKSRPRRTIIVLGGALLSFFLVMCFAFFIEYFNRFQLSASVEVREKLQNIHRLLRIKK